MNKKIIMVLMILILFASVVAAVEVTGLDFDKLTKKTSEETPKEEPKTSASGLKITKLPLLGFDKGLSEEGTASKEPSIQQPTPSTELTELQNHINDRIIQFYYKIFEEKK